jgi:hypothetical protein
MQHTIKKVCNFATELKDCQTLKQKENEESIICNGSRSSSHHFIMLQQQGKGDYLR